MSDRAGQGVPSPCVNICSLNAQDICVGCGRALTEIVAWPEASDPERRAIRTRAEQRLQRLLQPERPEEKDEGSA